MRALLLPKIFTMSRFLLIISLFAVLGCSKKEELVPVELPKPEVPKIPVSFSVSHTFGTSPLSFDEVIYTSLAGYSLSVTDVKYYLSRVEIEDTEGTRHRMLDYMLVNARKEETQSGQLPQNLKAKALHFIIGFNKEDNRHEYLENTIDNFNMIWPTEMGGGYHFLKFEGRYVSTEAKQQGFALHLGENGYEVYVELPLSFDFTKEKHSLSLNMDVKNWLQNPIKYDFEKDGNYSMGIAENMLKLTKNGNDVLSIKSIE
jgi:hypothetical protein